MREMAASSKRWWWLDVCRRNVFHCHCSALSVVVTCVCALGRVWQQLAPHAVFCQRLQGWVAAFASNNDDFDWGMQHAVLICTKCGGNALTCIHWLLQKTQMHALHTARCCCWLLSIYYSKPTFFPEDFSVLIARKLLFHVRSQTSQRHGCRFIALEIYT